MMNGPSLKACLINLEYTTLGISIMLSTIQTSLNNWSAMHRETHTSNENITSISVIHLAEVITTECQTHKSPLKMNKTKCEQ